MKISFSIKDEGIKRKIQVSKTQREGSNSPQHSHMRDSIESRFHES